MLQDRFWLLVSLKFSGEASAEELAELDTMVQQYPDLGFRASILENILSRSGGDIATNKEDVYNKHLQRLSNHFATPVLKYETEEPPKPAGGRPTRKYLWWLSVPAAAAVAIGFILYYPSEKETKKINHVPALNTVSTKSGSKSKVQLPDGTQVWLNADSKITYDENFMGNVREVQLSGEAYFDVVKNKTHPFIIHTHSIDLKVLGTAFNVRSYDNEKNTETSLLRGSVEITLRNNPDKKIILSPNEKLMVQNDDFSLINNKPAESTLKEKDPMMILSKVHFKKEDSLPVETLWLKNKLAFDGESLEDVASKIERWYDVKVNILDEKLKNSQYSAVFEDESLQQVMEALRLTGNFKYTINKKEVTIKP